MSEILIAIVAAIPATIAAITAARRLKTNNGLRAGEVLMDLDERFRQFETVVEDKFDRIENRIDHLRLMVGK
jgi:hypothetical protein